MGYILLAMFIIIAILCYLEEYIKKYQKPLFFLIGLVLIIIAGFREIGLDPDSENYEKTFLNYFKNRTDEMVEPSFLLISYILRCFTDNVHILFLIYALFGVSLKMFAFRKLTEFYFIPLLCYISFYYVLHDLTQIRAGVVSGIFLIALHLITENKKKIAFLLLLGGSLIHYSSLTLLPIIFLNNKPFNKKTTILFLCAIPLGYVVFYAGGSILMNPSIPFIGNKLAIYQTAVEKGKITVAINIFDPLHIMSILLFYYLFLFKDTLTKLCSNFPILLKTSAIGLSLYSALSFLPVLALRTSQLYCIVNILLYTYLIYTIKQKWIGITIVVIISLILLYVSIPHYGLGNIIMPD
uniref:EpsG family protein n=1 Tax=Segatella hominis TaxID=2518605 RepID=UPI0040268BF6